MKSEDRAKGFTGTGTAPIFAAPKKAATNSAESGSTIKTRSPRQTPCASSAFPARLASVASSPQVTSRGSPTMAGRPGCDAAGASRKCSAIFNFSGISPCGNLSMDAAIVPDSTNSRLLGRGSRASDSNFVPRRARRVERIIDFGIILFAGADRGGNGAFVDQNRVIVGADVSGLIGDLAVAVHRGLILDGHEPDG